LASPTRLLHVGKLLGPEAAANGCAEPLPVGVLHVPLVWVVDPEKPQLTEPIGTGMEFEVLDCHIRYMVAAKFRVEFV
jgi:hypothetical protein